jgi:hypothetical protein
MKRSGVPAGIRTRVSRDPLPMFPYLAHDIGPHGSLIKTEFKEWKKKTVNIELFNSLSIRLEDCKYPKRGKVNQRL